MLNYLSSQSFHTLRHWQSSGETWGIWYPGELAFITQGFNWYLVKDGQTYSVSSGITAPSYPEGFSLHDFSFSISSMNRIKVRMNGNSQPESERNPNYYYTPPFSIDDCFSVWGDQITMQELLARPEPEDRATWLKIGLIETLYPGEVMYYDTSYINDNLWHEQFQNNPEFIVYDENGKEYRYKYAFQEIRKGKL